ncbi:hypothetical protein [Streptomyces fuscichromogenes]|uniref:Uncharacterized protein n=1 Tax=Streptomyces fuscichromogenes TaxID=1324013 RepID=A0A917UIC0_9ACTN|nr:hypothetical protein [Streptomyces fuscichromogenes]GGM96404.1 hypothetical protein GCM10011578_016270 [Streptomyces fuscichromogenes]
MTTTEPTAGPCVSLSTGTLCPDQRVNYSYGMVLGLDEFLQEQLYHQEKTYRHRRLLHGYGTSYGLQVSIDPGPGGSRDYVIGVSRGAGIDQWGREFTVPEPQCLRLQDWLTAQEQAQPGIIQEHNEGSGGATIYAVASYAECLDSLVPLPGQPCGTGEQTQVPSRIRDSWTIELRWDPPPMPRWDSDRRLGRLLASVSVVEQQVGSLPNETDLFAAVRALADDAPNGPGDVDQLPTQPLGYEIGRWQAARVWDEVFAIWVSEVRPRLEPDLITPSETSDPAVLLGAIDIFGISADVGTIWGIQVEDAGRPSVLNTQLIQELPPPQRTDREPVELVTLVPSPPTASAFTIDAWFHLDNPVTLTGPIQVVTEAGIALAFTATAKPVGPGESSTSASVWTLTPPSGFKPTAGQQLSARFESDAVHVAGSLTLNQWRDRSSLRFLNTAQFGGAVLAYTTANGTTSTLLPEAPQSERTAADPQTPPAATPLTSAPFVTITDTGATADRLDFELWFHPDPRGTRRDMLVQTPQVRAYDETTGDPLTVTDPTQDPRNGNVWHVTTSAPAGSGPLPAHLRFVFPAEGFTLTGADSGSTALASWIDSAAVEFTGWDRGEASIVVFHRVPASGGEQPDAAPTTRTRTTRAKTAAPRTTGGRGQQR